LLAGGLFFVGAPEVIMVRPIQDKILLAALIVGVIGTIYTSSRMHLGPGRYFSGKDHADAGEGVETAATHAQRLGRNVSSGASHWD